MLLKKLRRRTMIIRTITSTIMAPILRLPLMKWTKKTVKKTMKLAKKSLNLIPTLTNKLKKDTFHIRNTRALATLTMTFCYQIRLHS